MYKFYRNKKKITLLLSFLIFITCNSIVTACSIDNLFIHRKGILNALNAPNNSLLQFHDGFPSLLVENMVALIVSLILSAYIYYYQMARVFKPAN